MTALTYAVEAITLDGNIHTDIVQADLVFAQDNRVLTLQRRIDDPNHPPVRVIAIYNADAWSSVQYVPGKGE